MRGIQRRRLKFLDHVMQRQQMENICMTGGSESRRGIERPIFDFLDSLMKPVGGEQDRWNCCRSRAGEKTADPWWSTSLGIRHHG